MSEWQNRPLDPVYPVVLVDAIHVKIRDGQVANRPIYLAMGVTVDGSPRPVGWVCSHLRVGCAAVGPAVPNRGRQTANGPYLTFRVPACARPEADQVGA